MHEKNLRINGIHERSCGVTGDETIRVDIAIQVKKVIKHENRKISEIMKLCLLRPLLPRDLYLGAHNIIGSKNDGFYLKDHVAINILMIRIPRIIVHQNATSTLSINGIWGGILENFQDMVNVLLTMLEMTGTSPFNTNHMFYLLRQSDLAYRLGVDEGVRVRSNYIGLDGNIDWSSCVIKHFYYLT